MAVALLTAGIASAQITYSIGYINTNSSEKTEVKILGVTSSTTAHTR